MTRAVDAVRSGEAHSALRHFSLFSIDASTDDAATQAADHAALLALLSDGDLPARELLCRVASCAVELTSAQSVGIGHREPGDDESPPRLRWVAMAGAADAVVGHAVDGSVLPWESCLRGSAPQLWRAHGALSTQPIAGLELPVQSCLLWPLSVDAAPTGVFVALSHEAGVTLGNREHAVLGMLRGLACIAMRAHLVEEERTALRSRASDDRAPEAAWAAQVVHDLRTPLSAITMWIHVLRKGGPEDRARAVEAIHQSARELSSSMEELLERR